ncbi:DUF2541 family protein [Photobacterium sp. BZF1]|uniref:DUF2541 family protein n=1 Tax=Photobacterium TaxID=657 RepID=UPI001653AE39|nr:MULTISPECIES: DUF2541 family protein [Photobacterium]MBC7004558.1 DUF2541 family protein [Photobacterium sp. BZF1]MBY5946648.1 DUF2541 family protein [Photobacterium rosenbergii]
MKTHVMYLALSLGLLGASPFAHADDKITLGRTILLGKSDHGAQIPLLVCRRVDAIKVKAERDMRLERVVVTFNNDDTKTIHFHRKLDKHDQTDWRKFAYTRCVKSLEVYGKAEGSSAGVRVYGRQ